jgi:hypothetical protein
VFTARYALSSYIKQIRFVFKGLIHTSIQCNIPLLYFTDSLTILKLYWIQVRNKQYLRVFKRSELFWGITRAPAVIVYRRFGTTYRSHLQGSRGFSNSWPLKMGTIRCPETSVNNYHSTPRNIPEERRSHQRRGGSLTSLQGRIWRLLKQTTVTDSDTVLWMLTQKPAQLVW